MVLHVYHNAEAIGFSALNVNRSVREFPFFLQLSQPPINACSKPIITWLL
jgi:hypothetical protein